MSSSKSMKSGSMTTFWPFAPGEEEETTEDTVINVRLEGGRVEEQQLCAPRAPPPPGKMEEDAAGADSAAGGDESERHSWAGGEEDNGPTRRRRSASGESQQRDGSAQPSRSSMRRFALAQRGLASAAALAGQRWQEGRRRGSRGSRQELHVGMDEAGEYSKQPGALTRKQAEKHLQNRTAQMTDTSEKYRARNRRWIIMPYDRVHWDVLLLCLIFIVLLVTPFELTFLRDLSIKEAALTRPKRRGLFYLNRCIDACFLVDVFLCFNTAYWKFETGWVTDRRRIAKHYCRTWLVYDLVAAFPYDLIAVDVAYVRLLRVVRLLRLLRLVKQPRIMANLKKHITLKRSQQAIIRYILLLLCLVHWSACLLQLLTSELLSHCDTKEASLRHESRSERSGDDDVEECPRTFLNYQWNDGVWARYFQAVGWATATLFGEIVASNNLAETILASAIGLIGVIVLAILVGDLCNLFSNLDPVKNEFSLSFDYLNKYLDSIAMPVIMRKKLREFMLLSEEVFRENYNKGLIHRLSPEMEAILARQSLRSIVERVPFYVFALSHGAGLAPGSCVRVWRHHSVDGWMHPSKRKSRSATVLQVHHAVAKVTVRYDSPDPTFSSSPPAGTKGPVVERRHRLSSWGAVGGPSLRRRRRGSRNPFGGAPSVSENDDDIVVEDEDAADEDDDDKTASVRDGEVETILITRIASHSLETRAKVARHARLLYERDRFVRDMARLFRLRLYLAYEDVCVRDLSLTDSMYAIHAGRVAVFGRSSPQVLKLEILGVSDVFGEDITATLVGPQKPLPRHYAVKTLSNVFLLVLDGDEFFQAIKTSGATAFLAYCRHYGSWLLLKRSVLTALRHRVLLDVANRFQFETSFQASEPLVVRASTDDERCSGTTPSASSSSSEQKQTPEQRLTTIQLLRTKNLITNQEAADARARVLAEL